MGYTRVEMIEKCKKAMLEANTFYKQGFINYRGKTSDTNEYYTEVISEYLCNNINVYMNSIPEITREASYKTEGHDGEFSENSNRDEEIIAMKMYKQSKNCDYDFVGKMIDYQTPLKNKRCDEAGKIDLLSFDGKTVRVLELKKPDSSETMLRCVLEGYTYLKTANKEKLFCNFGLPKNAEFKASPFVFKDKIQHEEFKENRPHLTKLMSLLDSKPYLISEVNEKFIVEE